MKTALDEHNSAIKKLVVDALLEYPDDFRVENIHFNFLEDILKSIEWVIDWDCFEPNGWQHDVWFDVKVPNKDFYYELEVSWYYPTSRFTKKYNNGQN